MNPLFYFRMPHESFLPVLQVDDVFVRPVPLPELIKIVLTDLEDPNIHNR